VMGSAGGVRRIVAAAPEVKGPHVAGYAGQKDAPARLFRLGGTAKGAGGAGRGMGRGGGRDLLGEDDVLRCASCVL